jgi:uncharacterized protein YndB with AHSA1/START domain
MTMATAIEPLTFSIEVDAPREHAFRVFTEEIASWWPLEKFGILDGRDACFLEGRVGGRVYERTPAGAEAIWGEVVVWEPPARLVVSWSPTTTPRPRTEWEARFSEHEGGTLLEFEHRGWERLGEAAGEARAEYAGGWATVLALYQKHAGSSAR